MDESRFESPHFDDGVVLAKKGRNPEALAKFIAAAEQYPDWPRVHHNMAACLNNLGKTNEAIIAYRKAIAVYPTFIPSLNDLAILLRKTGETKEAFELYEVILRHVEGHKEVAYYNYAYALSEAGFVDLAVEKYRIAVSINPAYVSAHYNLGLNLVKQGNTAEAIDSFRQALSYKPDHKNALFSLATNLSTPGRSDEAIPVWESYLKLYPNDSSALANLAVCVLARAVETKSPHMVSRSRKLAAKALLRNPLNVNAWLLLKESVTP